MNTELERLTQSLIEMVSNPSLDPIVAQALKYAYVLGKFDGTQEAILEVTRKQA
jgi:hypothetical protein